MEHLAELGVGGIFALLIIKEVLSFIRKKPASATASSTQAHDLANIQTNLKSMQGEHCSKEHDRTEKLMESMAAKMKDLHRWHDVEDTEGVKVWYVRKSLENAIVKLSSSIEKQTDLLRVIDKQTELLRVIADEFRTSRKDFQCLADEVYEMKKMNM